MNLFNQNYYMQIHTHSKLQLEKKQKTKKTTKNKTKQNKTKCRVQEGLILWIDH